MIQNNYLLHVKCQMNKSLHGLEPRPLTLCVPPSAHTLVLKDRPFVQHWGWKVVCLWHSCLISLSLIKHAFLCIQILLFYICPNSHNPHLDLSRTTCVFAAVELLLDHGLRMWFVGTSSVIIVSHLLVSPLNNLICVLSSLSLHNVYRSYRCSLGVSVFYGAATSLCFLHTRPGAVTFF